MNCRSSHSSPTSCQSTARSQATPATSALQCIKPRGDHSHFSDHTPQAQKGLKADGSFTFSKMF